MFNNIGKKIKVLASVLLVVGAIALVVITSNLKDVSEGLAIAILIVVLLIIWISLFAMYGFGELVDQSQIANEQLAEIQELLKQNIAATTNQNRLTIDQTNLIKNNLPK